MNKLVPYKFEVIAVCHVVDEDGNIVAEQPVGRPTQDGGMQPVTVFSVSGLADWAAGFEGQLERINAQQTPEGK
jgi:hypothetical protein